MARSMGGRSGGSRSGGGGRGSGRSGGSRSGAGRSSSSRSIGGSRSGSSRTFGTGRSGGSSSRGSGRSYSGGGSSYGNPGLSGGHSSNSGYHNHGYNHGHYGHHHHHHHGSYYGGGGYYGRRTYRRSSGMGCSSCLTTFLAIIIVFAILSSLASFSNNNPSFSEYGNQEYSNIERDKFTGEVHLNGYYSDPDGLLYDDEIKPIENGLKHFYQKTGACAYVYIVEELPPGVDGIEEAAVIYEDLFDDEGHLLLLYDYMNATMYDACGYEIQTTIDSEAIDIIYDFVEAKWSRDSENLGAIFGEGLYDAADRIMFKERSFGEKYKGIIITVIICIVLIIVVNVLYKWWKAKKAQENKEQADLERTLNTPLETFGSDINDLAKKYDDPNNTNNSTTQ